MFTTGTVRWTGVRLVVVLCTAALLCGCGGDEESPKESPGDGSAPAPDKGPVATLPAAPPSAPVGADVSQELDRAAKCLKAGDLDGALQACTEAIGRNASAVKAYRYRAAIFGLKKDYAAAIRDETQVIALEPNHATHYVNRGIDRDKAGDAAGALEDFSRAISLDPKHGEAYLLRGFLRRKTDAQAALSDFTSAIQHSLDAEEAYHARAGLRMGMRDLDGAIQDYTQVMKLTEGDDAEVFLNRGTCYSGVDKVEEAIRDFSRALEIDPELDEALERRAVSRFLKKDYDGAWDDVNACEKRGVKLLPEFLADLREASGRSK